MTLRELRRWHWRHVTSKREDAKHYREQGNHRWANHLDRLANFHLKAVQVLNDVCPENTTAEYDETWDKT